jgi:predicted RNA-binding protein with PUA-like domain
VKIVGEGGGGLTEAAPLLETNMDIFEEAQAVRGLKVEGICAMGVYAARHLSPKGLMKKKVRDEIKTAWDGADPLAYARAAKLRPTWFARQVDVSEYQLYSVIEIGKLKDRQARELLAEQMANTTMSYFEVRDAVASMTKPKRKEKQIKHCPFCGETL